MDAKLTLSLDSSVIREAKNYAKTNGISLSRLIEMYLKLVTNEVVEEQAISPLVKELSGVIPMKNTEYRKDYSKFLSKKHN